jgi:3-carboxy-cis,cis-muconate cycloisomerase
VAERSGLFGGVFSRGAAATGDHAWLRAMLDTEAALARALERAGLARAGGGAGGTAGAGAAAAATGPFDLGALGRQAAQYGNPVPGLVAALRKAVPPGAADTVHRGATSQDIIDTAAMLLARDALEAMAVDLAAAAGGCAGLAEAHRDTLMAGRTLLQQAVPVTFGLVAAGWLTALDEAGEGIARVRAERLAVQFGGAAGTLASLGDDGPAVARLLAGELGLALPVLPWHTDRSRIVEVAAACAGVSAALAKIARDVTLLAQSEVGEVREGGGPGGERRGGSSAMPHKQNPVAAIAILGCTRRVPGLAATLIAAAEQEHQRAAGAWHAEWEPFADLLRVTGSAAAWAADLTGGLVVDPARMRANLDATRGLPLAERVAGLLAPALGRAAAHDLVARASAHAVAVGGTLREALLGVPELAGWMDGAGITGAQVEAALDPAGYLGSAGAFTDGALAAHARRSLPQA